MKETTKAKAAKAFYAAMPPSQRSIHKLHGLLKEEWQGRAPGVRRLEVWSSAHGWQKYVEEYDLERAEEKRKKREERIEEINVEMERKSMDYFKKSQDYIDYLIENGKLGSQAAVQFYKITAELARLALGADKPKEQQQQNVPIQIIIEADNTPTIIPKVVDAGPLPALPEPSQVFDSGEPIIEIVDSDE